MKFLLPLCFLLICFGSQVNAFQKDTTYKRGDFLIDVSGKTNIDVVSQGSILKHKTSKGDTLFENEKYVVLGDDANLVVYGLFKKVHLKHSFPDFSTPVYKGKLAKPDFKTDREAYSYRTQFRDQCKLYGVNFAGHYTVVKWGCGSDCQAIGIVDRINGKIYYSKLPYVNDILAYGLECHAGSRLLLINAGLLEPHKGYVECSSFASLAFFEWMNNKVRRLPE